MAVDANGFRDGKNNGPYQDEKLTREVDVDIIWRYDMMEELGVLQHNMANSSPVSYGNLIFVSTSNGQDESHVNVPSPNAPAIIALDKRTGELVWEDNPVGERIAPWQQRISVDGDVDVFGEPSDEAICLAQAGTPLEVEVDRIVLASVKQEIEDPTDVEVFLNIFGAGLQLGGDGRIERPPFVNARAKDVSEGFVHGSLRSQTALMMCPNLRRPTVFV
jgi:hypothetical protein